MAKLEMRRFATTVLRDKSSGDNAQIPLSDATLHVYKQGATISAITTVTSSNTTVAVFNVGKLVVGDVLQLGTDDTKTMTVISVNSDVQVTLRRVTNDVALSVGDRLVKASDRPDTFADSTGTLLIGADVSLDEAGQGSFYCPESRFDYIVSGTGITPTLYIDAESGWERGGTTWVNVMDFPTFQAAVDSIPVSTFGFKTGVVYVPAGTYSPSTVPAFTGVVLQSGTAIIGETAGVYLTLPAGYENTDMIVVVGSVVRLENLNMIGPGVPGSGVGLNVGNRAVNLQDLIVRNCSFAATASWGIKMEPLSSGYIGRFLFEQIAVITAASGGSLKLGWSSAGCNSGTFFRCTFNGPGFSTLYGTDNLTQGYCHLENNFNVGFHHCTFERVDCGTAVSFGTLCYTIAFANCHFETGTADGNKGEFWITVDPSSGVANITFDTCMFVRLNSTTQGCQILKSGANSRLNTVVFRDCYASSAKNPDDATDDIVMGHAADNITISNCYRTGSAFEKGWAISSATSRPLIGYLLSGFPDYALKLPGVTDHTAIKTTPIDGMMVWNSTDHAMRVYRSSEWKYVSSFTKGTAGAPSTGDHAAGDVCVNTNDSKIYVCVTSGTPGTWKSVAVT